ncbi:MAG TPA: ABC transporter ATP-binding protein [Candidatus Limnocylindrales bacterium]|nr:ABC transporter ATP-binding protein [Candidatus Limnocylindrales bacterium]
MIRLQEVTKIYNRGSQQVVALQQVTLEMGKGEFVAFMGPSGCGKSTLLNLVGGLDVPTSGEVFIDNLSLGKLSDRQLSLLRREKIGIVFQFFNLLPTLNVQENTELPLLLQGVSPKEASRRAEVLLSRVGLSHRMTHAIHELSGGEMQRVAIARALIHNPEIILADEPTGNLDSKTGSDILKLLKSFSEESEYTVLLATHSLEATRYADRVINLRDGRVLNSPSLSSFEPF